MIQPPKRAAESFAIIFEQALCDYYNNSYRFSDFKCFIARSIELATAVMLTPSPAAISASSCPSATRCQRRLNCTSVRKSLILSMSFVLWSCCMACNSIASQSVSFASTHLADTISVLRSLYARSRLSVLW